MTFQVEVYTLGLKFPRWTPDGLKAVFTIDGPNGTIHSGDIQLQSVQAKDALSRFLDGAARLALGKGQWAIRLSPIISQFISESQLAFAPVRLMDIVPSTDDVMAHVQGVSFLPKHHSIFFGFGEAYKSLVALWLAGHSGLRVLYLDWELTADDHRRRLQGLFGEFNLPSNILYLKAKLPLHQSVDYLRKIVTDEAVELIVVDSVAFSTNLAAETSEAALIHFGALEEIGVGSISIAHLTKQIKRADKGREQPFGSTFWHNSARFTLLFERQPSGTVLLSPRKSNLVARPPNVELNVKFGETGTIEITSMAELMHEPLTILDYVTMHPGMSKTNVLQALGGKTEKRLAEINDLINKGIICNKKGGKAERLTTCVH